MTRLLGTREGDAEEIERLLLNGCGSGEDGERLVGGVGRDDRVARQGREIGEQALKAVRGNAVGPSPGRALGEGSGRALSPGDGADAQCFSGVLVVVVVEHRGETGTHMPLDVIGQHAQEDVGAHALLQPMVDRPDVQIDGLQATKRALHLGERLVGATASASSRVAFGQLVRTA